MNLSVLKEQTAKLGLEVRQSGKRPAKRDYQIVLRGHFLKADYPDGAPYEELTPMGLFDFWELGAKQQAVIWKSPDWIAQVKMNGVRAVLHFVKGRGVFAHSRVISDVNYRRTELTEHLLTFGYIPSFTATIDCEIVGPNLQATVALLRTNPAESRKLQLDNGYPLTIHAFDVTQWEYEDIRKRKLEDRLGFLVNFQDAVKQTEVSRHFTFPQNCFTEKEKFYLNVIQSGGEGVVLKYLRSHYIDTSARSRLGWLKVKKKVEFDAFVSGFERGRPGSDYERKVASLTYSVNTDEGPVVIAKIATIPWETRKAISLYDKKTDTVSLSPEILGTCAHVAGLELSRRARRLVHGRLDHPRKDLKPEDCVYRFSDIEALRRGETTAHPMRIVGKCNEPLKDWTPATCRIGASDEEATWVAKSK